jgi:predicted GTPase
MGYSDAQLRELEAVINACDCDVVLAGTPMDLTSVITVNKPVVRVTYELEEKGDLTLHNVLADFKKRTGY